MLKTDNLFTIRLSVYGLLDTESSGIQIHIRISIWLRFQFNDF